jgi:hypothetical protein
MRETPYVDGGLVDGQLIGATGVSHPFVTTLVIVEGLPPPPPLIVTVVGTQVLPPAEPQSAQAELVSLALSGTRAYARALEECQSVHCYVW